MNRGRFKMSNVKKTVISALCVALCVVLPMAFHAIPGAANVCSPMHIPVLLCGLICGPLYGLLCGLAGPALSTLLTGMPPAAYLPSMLAELAVYGLVTGVMMRLVHTGKKYADLYISLVTAMLMGRVVAGILRAFVFAPGSYSMNVWITSYFITSWPGIVIHLIFVPMVYFAVKKSSFSG